MSSIGEDIEKHKHALKSSKKHRRLSIPVSPNLQAVIDKFKATYPDVNYLDTRVITTLLEAGCRVWVAHQQTKKTMENNDG